MASRAGTAPDWRAAFRRSFRRSTHMAGAGILFALLVFLTLALASYTQTDPSPSTAASGEDIRNWMGASGAWASERALNFLGIPAVLLLPLLLPDLSAGRGRGRAFGAGPDWPGQADRRQPLSLYRTG